MIEDTKIFEVWRRESRYLVAKCPNCGKEFRRAVDWDKDIELGGKKVQRFSCPRCEKFFPIFEIDTQGKRIYPLNLLDEDNMIYGTNGSKNLIRREIVGGKVIKEYKFEAVPSAIDKELEKCDVVTRPHPKLIKIVEELEECQK